MLAKHSKFFAANLTKWLLLCAAGGFGKFIRLQHIIADFPPSWGFSGYRGDGS